MMNIHDAWEKALQNTEIIRSRVQALLTFADTKVPYIILSQPVRNSGDTVVRKGEVIVNKPSIILPPNIPQFEGFDFGQKEPVSPDDILGFLLVRGITLPSLKYNNKPESQMIHKGNLDETIRHYLDELQRREDVHTGLIAGPDDCWQFSMLIFICTQAARNADTDIRKLLDEYRKKNYET